MRVKSHWFKNEAPKTPEDIASAAAFIAWRIADHALKQTRKAGFAIDIGPQYFDFMAEFLYLLVQCSDRLLYAAYPWNVRVRFIHAMANKVADTWAGNRADLLGESYQDTKALFIQQLNARGDGYAEHDYQPGGDNFAFLRYLGHGMTSHMQAPDQRWILDQLMTLEAPEALRTMEKSFQSLLDTTALELPDSPITCPE